MFLRIFFPGPYFAPRYFPGPGGPEPTGEIWPAVWLALQGNTAWAYTPGVSGWLAEID